MLNNEGHIGCQNKIYNVTNKKKQMALLQWVMYKQILNVNLLIYIFECQFVERPQHSKH